jgi:thiol-disulfide isomerase/thioredoxin
MESSTLSASRRNMISVALALVTCCAPLSLTASDRAPGLKLKDLQGARQNLSDLRGRIVVVNFWATWCAPCQEELPRLDQLAQEWTGKHVSFVAVSIDEPKDQAKIAPMLDRLHVTPNADFAVWIGSSSYTLRSFGLGDVVPGTVVIDGEGQIVTHIMGEARNEDVRTAVDWLLDGRTGNPPPEMVKRY